MNRNQLPFPGFTMTGSLTSGLICWVECYLSLGTSLEELSNVVNMLSWITVIYDDVVDNVAISDESSKCLWKLSVYSYVPRESVTSNFPVELMVVPLIAEWVTVDGRRLSGCS